MSHGLPCAEVRLSAIDHRLMDNTQQCMWDMGQFVFLGA